VDIVIEPKQSRSLTTPGLYARINKASIQLPFPTSYRHR
jgi:hypothetical protein